MCVFVCVCVCDEGCAALVKTTTSLPESVKKAVCYIHTYINIYKYIVGYFKVSVKEIRMRKYVIFKFTSLLPCTNKP